MKTLHINVVDKIATYYKRDGDIVCGNSDYQLEFTFDSEWDAHNSKTARIIINGEYKDVPFLGNVCTLPIIKNATQIEVGVYAGDLNTTTRAIIGCKPSILCGSSVPASNEEMDKEYTSAAKEAAQTAIGAAETAVGAVGKAEIAADRAEDALERAEEAAERAEAAGDDGNEAVIGVLESDTTVSSVKPVPETSAPYAEVVEIGGMTRKCTNLIPFPYKSGGAGYVSESNGMNISVLNDGGIAFSGTPTSYVGFVVYNGAVLSKGEQVISLQGTFSGVYAVLYLYDSNGSEIAQFSLSPTNNSLKLNMGSYPSAASMNITIARGSTGSPVNGTVYPMLNPGNTALPYEPYFEGLRSAPTTEVESVGVNIFDISKRLYGDIDSNGDLKCTHSQNKFYEYKFKSDMQYTLSGYVKNESSGANVRLAVFYTDGTSEKVVLLNGSTDWVYKTYTTEAGKTVKSIRMHYGNNGAMYIKGGELMINEGTTAQPYRPYFRNTLPIPEAVRNLDGYGWGVNDEVYNYVDWKKKQFVKRVGCVDLGTLDWNYSTGGKTRFDSNSLANVIKQVAISDVANIVCSNYEVGSSTQVYNGTAQIAVNSTYVWIYDTNYTDVASFKAAMSGVMLYYELAKPVITDISDILPDNLIGVEDGGTLTFNNEFGYDVPNTVNFYTYNNELMCADTFVGDLKGTANKAIYDSKGRDIAEKLDELANGSGGSGGEGSPSVGIESVEQTVTSNVDGGTNEITVTLTDGSKSKFNVKNGSQGSPGTPGGKGDKGDPGVGIESVEQTTTSTVDGGTNVITVKLTDGKTYTFTVKNGSTGSGGSGGGGSGENTAAAEAAAARAEAAEAKALEYADSASTSSSEAKGYRDQAFDAQVIAENAAESTSQDATTTKEYRDQAKEHADQAGLSETEALLAAGAAETSASNAAESASEASQAASDLSGAAERAEEAAQNAESHETQCYEYSVSCSAAAETARSRAEAAELFAGEAEGHRDEAKGYSDTAQISAGDAADEANKAEQSASAAKTSETNAAKSATDAASAASDLSGAAERAEASEIAADGHANAAYEYATEAAAAALNAATHLQTMRDMAEIWTFTFADGTVVTKKVCIVD
jgi:hypothetical protein